MLNNTACEKKVYSVKVYGLKSCGSCKVLIDDFKKDEDIQLHVIDIDTHLKDYQHDLTLYQGLPENQAPVLMTKQFAKAGYQSQDYQTLKKAIIMQKKPNKKDYFKRR